VEACKALGHFEVIFVDDGSDDGTFEALKALPAPLKILRFRRNRGQTAAMDAGIKAARGRLIITMDGDLQNDPADIPKMLEKMKADGLDMICGWRRHRKDPLIKRFISRGAKLLRNLLVKDAVHDAGCSLKIYKRECFDTVDLYGEMHRFITGILAMKGFKVGEIEVTHHPRRHGKTKYNFTRTVKGFIDMIAIWFWKKFANRPLHLLGGAGLFMFLLGILSGLWVTYLKVVHGTDLSDTSLTILTMFLFFSGLNLFVMGIMADMISKTYYNSSKDQVYLVEEVVEKI
jgi:glycosyltransferase involved in cell wall biosynthesis